MPSPFCRATTAVAVGFIQVCFVAHLYFYAYDLCSISPNTWQSHAWSISWKSSISERPCSWQVCDAFWFVCIRVTASAQSISLGRNSRTDDQQVGNRDGSFDENQWIAKHKSYCQLIEHSKSIPLWIPALAITSAQYLCYLLVSPFRALW